MCESEGYTAEADALSAGFIEQRDVIADDIQRQFGIHGVIDAAENHAGEHRAAACELDGRLHAGGQGGIGLAAQRPSG